jgi:hypothetical protein
MKMNGALLFLSVTGFTAGVCPMGAHAHLLHQNDPSDSPMLMAFERRIQPRTEFQNAAQGIAATNRVSITVEGNHRIIRANGIPDHPTGAFPNRNNPNRIAEQDFQFKVPLQPKPAASPTPVRMQPFGIALNGILFDPAAAEWWQGDRSSPWQYEPMNMPGRLGADDNNAHVQPTGTYHYHAIPTGLLNTRAGGTNGMTLVGWAADGFPIYGPQSYTDAKNPKSPLKALKSSYRVKAGVRPDGPGGKYDGAFVADYEFVAGAGDLDECNGRFGITPEFPQGTYYYVLTEDFPFIPRLFKGTPDPSFARKGPPPGRPHGRPPGGHPDRRAEVLP